MPLAIFDIDGTLIGGSSERLFWRYLWRRRVLRPRQLAAFAVFMLRYLPVAGRDVAKKNKAYLEGFTRADVERLAAEFVAAELEPRLYEPAVARLRAHRQHGDTVLLLSGTLQPIAQALAERLGIEHVYATLCAERGGRLAPRPPERHPFDAAKLTFAREFAERNGFDLATASAYGDSHRDLELLEHVGRPVAVRPDGRLRRIARARGWDVIDQSDTALALRALDRRR